jgi:hypothetical protein
MLTLCLPAAGIQEVEAVAMKREGRVVVGGRENRRTRRESVAKHGRLRDHDDRCVRPLSQLVSRPFSNTCPLL